MIDEEKVIRKIQGRIDEFLKRHPGKKGCEAVRAQEEFIHMLRLEASEYKENTQKK